jgi:hypothetical protein
VKLALRHVDTLPRMSHSVRASLLQSVALLALGLGPVSVAAQQRPRLTLAAANAKLSEEFSNLTWVRELRDRRVIISDSRDGRVVVADLASGAVEQIGRRGNGPNEYTRVQPVWSIGGDSSVLMNSPQRWLLFSGASIVATLPPDAPGVSSIRGIARGADERGNVYSAEFVRSGDRPIGDSTALLRIARGTGKVDTLARLKALVPRRTSAADKNGYFSFSLPTLEAADEAVPFADGWVAIVRTDPYRVQWRSPDGKWVNGAQLPFSAIRIDDREKRAHMARLASPTGKAPSPPDSIADWPATLPPYRSPVMLLAAPDSRLLVPRLPSAQRAETHYDIVNRRGALDGELVLPPNERIVGFGAATVYVSVTDDDGIQRLRRHPWPPR